MRMILMMLVLAATGGVCAQPRLVESDDAGTILRGPVADVDWGRPLCGGDFDGDGFDDVVVAASEDYGDVISTVHILRGGGGAHGLGTIDLATNPADLVISGAALNDNLGSSMAAGDVTGDGVDDLLLVASTADYSGVVDCGVAYLLFGAADFYEFNTRSMADPNDWDLRIIGPVAYGDMGGANSFGGLDSRAAAIGDLNGDNYGDIVLGVHLADGNQSQAGRVYVKFGGPFPPGFTLNLSSPTSYEVMVWGAGRYDELGTIVATGDITGDGIDELILPNHYASEIGYFSSEGAVYVFRGQAAWPGFYNLASTSSPIKLRGAREWDQLGESVAVGDFNGDGVDDLAAAAPGADAGTFSDQRGDGIVYGLLGGPQYQTGTHLFNLALTAVDFEFVGEFEENLGTLVTAGDYNGDGIDDLAAAERFAGPATNGVVEVLLGRTDLLPVQYAAGVDSDIRIVGAAGDRIGFSLTTVNSNGDALDEVFFGTPFNNGYAGSAYVYTFISGDAEFDRDVDLRDLALLQPCCGTVFDEPPTVPCVLLDFTLDERVDGDDLPGLAEVFDGPI